MLRVEVTVIFDHVNLIVAASKTICILANECMYTICILPNECMQEFMCEGCLSARSRGVCRVASRCVLSAMSRGVCRVLSLEVCAECYVSRCVLSVMPRGVY